MSRPSRVAAAVVALSLSCALAFADAQATSQRTFVASNGSDLGACNLTSPCRSFTAAHAQTTAGGEIIVLDSAGYGPVTITKSISLIAPAGMYAGVTVFSGDGILVNAAGINVVLRGLSINGLGGNAGINVADAAEVHVESCIVSHMSSAGILMTSANALVVKDSIFRDIGTSGIRQYNGYATYENIRSERNTYRGFDQLSGVAAITRSTFQQNGEDGIHAAGRISIEGSVIHGNSHNGVTVDSGGSVALTRSIVDGNGATGIEVDDAFAMLTQSSVTRSGQTSATSPGIAVSGLVLSRVLLLESVVNGAGASAPGIDIGTNGIAFTYNNNAIAPPPNGALSSIPLQ